MKTKRRQVCTYRLSFNGSLCLLIIGKVRPDLAIRTIWNCERKLWKNICSFWICDSVVITPYAPYIKYLKQPAYKIKEGRGKLFFYMNNCFQTLYLISIYILLCIKSIAENFHIVKFLQHDESLIHKGMIASLWFI